MTPSDSAPAHAQPSITTVTRRDIFDYLRGMPRPWWGRLDEVAFLEALYDLDRSSSDHGRLPSVRADIQQHRLNNPDLDDDWVFEDPRLELCDGPDEVLLDFLARTVHPEVASGVGEAMKQVEELNRLLAPDGWSLRPHGSLSGRPIYTPVRIPPTGPLVPLPLNDDDAGKLDLVLGQTYAFLDCAGEETARDLLRTAVLTLRRDGGSFHPTPGDSWTADTYEAVLTVERELQPACTQEVKEVIWGTLETLLSQLGRTDVQGLVVEGDGRPLPNIAPDWRTQSVAPATPILRGLRLPFTTTSFDVTRGDFADLEIRSSQDSTGFHYLYDTRARRMITDFVLDDRPRVATLCSVTIIKKGDTFTPRIKLWKKDKRKPGEVSAELMLPDTGITRAVKAIVDTGDVHVNFWKVINFLQGCAGLNTPGDSLQFVAADEAQLTQLLTGQDRTAVLGAVRTAIGGGLTEEDIRLISNRKEQLQRFERLLTDPDRFKQEEGLATTRGAEAVWQAFFEANQWIFGYGLNLIACESIDDGKLERITTGTNIFGGAGKRIDAIMRSKGLISSMLFCEIKTHDTELLAKTPYRPGVFQASKELGGGVAQVQKTVSKALQLISHEFLTRIYEDDGTPTGVEVSTTRPRQALVIGSLREFTANGAVNPEMISSFELYRTSIQDVEIITFDELYQRACFIVEDR
ncbi:Shedu anti-phage system protein SduA domain-containing protein [Streptomyces sp. NBC_01477]|uniref:Shedu anti-phage system protein SduA domain-containing protein n=1 Tax=Streptomyces sp. NBC_01477 TaxID=2976015 RepID=UPI002E2FEAA5|nr:Shedu anti-phage system protein SduA domain-containing protein [Streptomyces sp. NBC_01477]